MFTRRELIKSGALIGGLGAVGFSVEPAMAATGSGVFSDELADKSNLANDPAVEFASKTFQHSSGKTDTNQVKSPDDSVVYLEYDLDFSATYMLVESHVNNGKGSVELQESTDDGSTWSAISANKNNYNSSRNWNNNSHTATGFSDGADKVRVKLDGASDLNFSSPNKTLSPSSGSIDCKVSNVDPGKTGTGNTLTLKIDMSEYNQDADSDRIKLVFSSGIKNLQSITASEITVKGDDIGEKSVSGFDYKSTLEFAFDLQSPINPSEESGILTITLDGLEIGAGFHDVDVIQFTNTGWDNIKYYNSGFGEYAINAPAGFSPLVGFVEVRDHIPDPTEKTLRDNLGDKSKLYNDPSLYLKSKSFKHADGTPDNDQVERGAGVRSSPEYLEYMPGGYIQSARVEAQIKKWSLSHSDIEIEELALDGSGWETVRTSRNQYDQVGNWKHFEYTATGFSDTAALVRVKIIGDNGWAPKVGLVEIDYEVNKFTDDLTDLSKLENAPNVSTTSGSFEHVDGSADNSQVERKTTDSAEYLEYSLDGDIQEAKIEGQLKNDNGNIQIQESTDGGSTWSGVNTSSDNYTSKNSWEHYEYTASKFSSGATDVRIKMGSDSSPATLDPSDGSIDGAVTVDPGLTGQENTLKQRIDMSEFEKNDYANNGEIGQIKINFSSSITNINQIKPEDQITVVGDTVGEIDVIPESESNGGYNSSEKNEIVFELKNTLDATKETGELTITIDGLTIEKGSHTVEFFEFMIADGGYTSLLYYQGGFGGFTIRDSLGLNTRVGHVDLTYGAPTPPSASVTSLSATESGSDVNVDADWSVSASSGALKDAKVKLRNETHGKTLEYPQYSVSGSGSAGSLSTTDPGKAKKGHTYSATVTVTDEFGYSIRTKATDVADFEINASYGDGREYSTDHPYFQDDTQTNVECDIPEDEQTDLDEWYAQDDTPPNPKCTNTDEESGDNEKKSKTAMEIWMDRFMG